MKENKIKEIKSYPSNIVILSDRDDEYSSHTIDYDGQQGEFSRAEWKEEISMFSPEEQNEILDALENTSNDNFFIKN